MNQPEAPEHCGHEKVCPSYWDGIAVGPCESTPCKNDTRIKASETPDPSLPIKYCTNKSIHCIACLFHGKCDVELHDQQMRKEEREIVLNDIMQWVCKHQWQDGELGRRIMVVTVHPLESFIRSLRKEQP